MRIVAPIIGLLLFAASSLAGTIADADRLAAGGDLDAAIAAYRALLESDADNGQASYGLGRALHSQGRLEEASESFHDALDQGFQPAGAMLRIGMIHLQQGDAAQAKEWLRKSFDAGLPVRDFVPSLPGAELVENDAALKRFVATLHPCERESNRRWDFWIGDWDVYSPSGRKIGESIVKRVAGGCALSESWQGQAAGTSLSWFDPARSLFVQHYIDSSGLTLDMAGVFADGEIRLSTAEHSPTKQRWTWAPLPGGRVAQTAVQWDEQAGEWREIWSSIYVPKGSKFQGPS